MEKEKQGKWYYSYPVLIVTFCLFWPVSLILTILRFRKRGEQEGGYKTRSKIALGLQIAIIVAVIAFVIITESTNSKWKKQFTQYMQEENYTEANAILAEHSKTAVYETTMEYYLDLWEKSGEYSGLEQVVEKYYDTLSDPVNFDEKIESRIQAIEEGFSLEQKEKVASILNQVSEARRIKESQAAAEQESKAQEESQKAAEQESKKESEAQAESQRVAEEESSKAEEEASKVVLESQKAAEKEAKAQAESQKAAEKKIAQSQAAAEKEQAKKEEAQARIEEAIKTYMQKSDSKTLKKLQKENSDFVKAALRQKMNKAAQNINQDNDEIDNVWNYCELYKNLYGADEIQKIIDVTQKVRSLKNKDEILDRITIAGKSFSLEDAYNRCESKELYVTQRLKTHYDDTISGAVRKELDSLNQPKGSEWVAYNVKYEVYGEYPGDDCAVICASQKNPFSKAGTYYISYIVSNETRNLKDSKGFTSTVPVYYMLDNVDDLYTRYTKSEERKTEISQEIDRLKLILAMQ